MPQPRRQGITDALRQRLLGALASGALREGARLPSTRELARDLKADPRVVAEAYRVLAREGLVELRPRSGVFLAPRPGGSNSAPQGASPQWLAEVVADGIRRGVSAPTLADALAAATRSRSLHGAVIAATADQSAGLARELRDDFGVQATGFLASDVPPEAASDGAELPRALQRAQLLVGTERTGTIVGHLAERLGVPHVVIDMRPDLLSPDWRLLLTQVTYAVIADPEFGMLVHAFVDGAEGARNLRVLVAGRDDLSEIPPEAPTYITEAARDRIGRHHLPGRLVAPARTLSDVSTRAIALAVVQAQLAPARGRSARRALAAA